LMLRVGRHQPSLLLLALFTGWVASPFIAMIAATARSKSWAMPALLVITASIAIYSYAAFGPPIAKPASIFLWVPLGSWLVLAIAIPITRFRSARGKARRVCDVEAR
jgi:ABC-type transport system involved in cytochrome c biogenesis permease subunit